MKIVQKLDAGDIYLQAKTKIEPSETAQTLHDRLSEMGSELILRTLEGVAGGEIKGIPQNEQLVTYAHKLTKKMGELNPAETAAEIDRKVRALNPWPGTRATLRNELWGEKIFKIKKARTVSGGDQVVVSASAGVPGAVRVHQDRIFWMCKDNFLEILELQEDGKRAVVAADFLNGLRGKKI